MPGNINIEELKRQAFCAQPIFYEKYQLNNDSPPAVPTETGCFSEPWTVGTTNEETDDNNNNNYKSKL